MAGSGYKDYFQVLGVDRSADANAIKKAFQLPTQLTFKRDALILVKVGFAISSLSPTELGASELAVIELS